MKVLPVLQTSNENKGLLGTLIGLVGRVFTSGLGDLGSIPDHVIPKTLKMVLDTSLLNTQQYKVHIKGKVEQSRERSSPPLHLDVVTIEKGAFGLSSTTVASFTFTIISTGRYYATIPTSNKKKTDCSLSCCKIEPFISLLSLL